MPIDRRARARIVSLFAFLVCLPAGFYVGITLIGHARFAPYVSTAIDRAILAGAVLGMPALAAYATYRFALGGHGVRAAALFWIGGGALGLGSLAFAGFYVATYFDALERERVAGQTRVSNVRDEPILAREGRRIGVRVSFAVEVPARRHAFEFQPQLSERESTAAGTGWRVPGLSLDVKQIQVDGNVGFSLADHRQPQLAPGRHNLAADLYPHVVHAETGREPCLSAAQQPRLPDSETPTRLRMVIPLSSYGRRADAEIAGETRNAYDIVAMYRAVLAGAIPPCPERK